MRARRPRLAPRGTAAAEVEVCGACTCTNTKEAGDGTVGQQLRDSLDWRDTGGPRLADDGRMITKLQILRGGLPMETLASCFGVGGVTS